MGCAASTNSQGVQLSAVASSAVAASSAAATSNIVVHVPGIRELPNWTLSFPNGLWATNLGQEYAENISNLMLMISAGEAISWTHELYTRHSLNAREIATALSKSGAPPSDMVDKMLPVANGRGVSAHVVKAGENGATKNMCYLKSGQSGTFINQPATFIGFPIPVHGNPDLVALFSSNNMSVVLVKGSNFNYQSLSVEKHFRAALSILMSAAKVQPNNAPGMQVLAEDPGPQIVGWSSEGEGSFTLSEPTDAQTEASNASRSGNFCLHVAGLKSLPVWETKFSTNFASQLGENFAQHLNCTLKLISDGRALAWDSSHIKNMVPEGDVYEIAHKSSQGIGNPSPDLVFETLPVANCDGVTAKVVKAGENGSTYNMVILEVDSSAKKVPFSSTWNNACYVGFPMAVYYQGMFMAFRSPDSKAIVIVRASDLYNGARGEFYKTALESLRTHAGVTGNNSPGASEMTGMPGKMTLDYFEIDCAGYPPKAAINHTGIMDDECKAARDGGNTGSTMELVNEIRVAQGKSAMSSSASASTAAFGMGTASPVVPSVNTAVSLSLPGFNTMDCYKREDDPSNDLPAFWKSSGMVANILGHLLVLASKGGAMSWDQNIKDKSVDAHTLLSAASEATSADGGDSIHLVANVHNTGDVKAHFQKAGQKGATENMVFLKKMHNMGGEVFDIQIPIQESAGFPVAVFGHPELLAFVEGNGGSANMVIVNRSSITGTVQQFYASIMVIATKMLAQSGLTPSTFPGMECISQPPSNPSFGQGDVSGGDFAMGADAVSTHNSDDGDGHWGLKNEDSEPEIGGWGEDGKNSWD